MNLGNLHDRHDRAIDHILDFENTHGLEETIRRLRVFMVSYLGLMEGPLPDAAREGLAVAKRFIAGEASYPDLETASDRCWTRLKSLDHRYDFSNPENLAIRAAWCTLSTMPTKTDLRQTIEYFLQFADRIEDHSSEIQTLLERHFGGSSDQRKAFSK